MRNDQPPALLGGFADPDPGRAFVRRLVDEELAELAASETNTKLGRLAESEMRTREAWRGPGRWSLIVAALALVVSVWAIVRTL